MQHLLTMNEIRRQSIKLVLYHLSSMHTESPTTLKQTKDTLNKLKKKYKLCIRISHCLQLWGRTNKITKYTKYRSEAC